MINIQYIHEFTAVLMLCSFVVCCAGSGFASLVRAYCCLSVIELSTVLGQPVKLDMQIKFRFGILLVVGFICF